MSKPGVLALSGEAKNFVLENFSVLAVHLKMIFPLVLVVALVKQIATVFMLFWVQPLIGLAMLFLYACFCLSWHRISLQGADRSHAINPLKLTKDEWKFISIFMLLTGVLSLLMFGLSMMTDFVLPKYGKGIETLGNLGSLVAVVLILCAYFRFAFILPARSVGVVLPLADVKRASRGLIWPLLGSTIIFGVLFIIVFFVYLLVVGMIAQVAGGEAGLGAIETILIAFFLSIPVYAGVFFILALYTTALSVAYKWGIQNNA